MGPLFGQSKVMVPISVLTTAKVFWPHDPVGDGIPLEQVWGPRPQGRGEALTNPLLRA